MSAAPRTPSLPDMPENLSPELYNYLEAVRIILVAATGGNAVKDKRPTVQDLIDAGVPNAENIT